MEFPSELVKNAVERIPDLPNQNKNYWLGIGKIDQSQDLYIELYHIINVPSSDRNIGTVKREKNRL